MEKLLRKVDNVSMVTGRIKLGAKELSRNPLSSDQLEGFFYWRWRGSLRHPAKVIFSEVQNDHSCLSSPMARQHLISFLNSNASQKRVIGLSKHSHTETHLQDGREATAEKGPFLVFNDLFSVVV